MGRVMILTDSGANPRSFPVNEAVAVEETYPYLLRKRFNQTTFWQLSVGNVTSDFLLSQAVAYLSDWNPNWVIIHSGLVDCRPEAFSEFQKQAIGSFGQRLLKKQIYNPSWIKRRQVERVTEKKFTTTVKRLNVLFPNTKISWLEIGAGLGYENVRPGVSKRCQNFNGILSAHLDGGPVQMIKELQNKNGFNSDNLHLNIRGHKIIFKKLLAQCPSVDLC